jgi:hypothetical protein
LVLFILAIGILPLSEAAGQSSLLDKAKDLLGGGDEDADGGLSLDEIGDGLRDALKVGTERVVDQVAQEDGFNADPEIHIPLPETLGRVEKALKTVGLSSMTDDLELRLNRAAEAAAPKAKDLFWDAIAEMTLEDVKDIYNGADDAATRYFQDKMSDPLADEMRPVIDESLAEVGAIQAYDGMMGEYSSLPLMPDVKADLTSHVLDLALEGLFYYLAQEEAAIRTDPAKRTTEVLQKVFGSS